MSPPETPDDFVDIIECLNGEDCDFVIVGAHALAIHGSPRATGDLDIFVRPSADNARRLMRALTRFGAPIAAHGLTDADFSSPGAVYQIGLPPRRIDLLTQLSGVSFDEALEGHARGQLGKQPARYIGLDAMLVNKRAAGRPKDLADVAVLEELKRRRHR